jgi:hypothetical protein
LGTGRRTTFWRWWSVSKPVAAQEVVDYKGIEFFLALRRLGKDAWLFNYNGQPYGLRNRADQKDYAIRLQQYFDHYLKGAAAPRNRLQWRASAP